MLAGRQRKKRLLTFAALIIEKQGGKLYILTDS
jgi:hypothetical protein